MRAVLALLALGLGACATAPEAEIDSARGDEVVIRVGAFAGLTEADKLAEQACGGHAALMDRATRDGDTDNTFYTYRCTERDFDRLRRKAG